MTINIEALRETGFLRLSQVLQLIPISKASWWEGCKNSRFPKPIKLGPRTTVWRVEDIVALINSFSQKHQHTSSEVKSIKLEVR